MNKLNDCTIKAILDWKNAKGHGLIHCDIVGTKEYITTTIIKYMLNKNLNLNVIIGLKDLKNSTLYNTKLSKYMK